MDLGIKSPDSSPSSSVFSCDAASIRSSVTSLSSSSAGAWESDDTVSDPTNAPQIAPLDYRPQFINSDSYRDAISPRSSDSGSISQGSTCALSPKSQVSDGLPLHVRQHPRRTRPQPRLNPQNGILETTKSRPPPSLIRQDVRKDNFVDGLVGEHDWRQLLEGQALTDYGSLETTTQTIETIWPLAQTCPSVANRDKKLIPLRTFVREVLKRSRTSYSTLLVALHYLILIMGSVPKYGNFTKEQIEDSAGCRAMQCGRRMFLAALVLASKYLQDRNYSARAWARISGLDAAEINNNERKFLSVVNWKLHIPEPLFQRWERIVLKYSPSAAASKTPRSCPSPCRSWQSIIPQLNPDLDQFDDKGVLISDNDSGYYSSSSRASSRDSSPHALRTASEPIPYAELVPADTPALPPYLEPTPFETNPSHQMLPPLQPREGPLPTPSFTPRNLGFCTPAVSASGLLPRTSSMAMAMAQSRKCWDESLLDRRDSFSPTSMTSNPSWIRRFSRTSSTLSKASSPPESIWDQSRNPSRSSSISSVASSSSAASKPDLAWQAMHRRVNMQSWAYQENEPSTLGVPPLGNVAWNNPFPAAMNIPSCGELDPPTISVGDSSTASPLDTREGSQDEPLTPSTIADEATPRAPPTSTPVTDVPCQRTYDAAVALCELDLERKSQCTPCPRPTSACRSRKRERPLSMDMNLQTSVRDIFDPHHGRQPFQEDNEETIVISDEKAADSSFLRNDDNTTPQGPEATDRELRCLAFEETRQHPQQPQQVVYPDPWAAAKSYFYTSSVPRKKACVPAAGSELGQKGLSVRRGNGNIIPVQGACVTNRTQGFITRESSVPRSRPMSQSTALKENNPLHSRSNSLPLVKPLSNEEIETKKQAAGAELHRMLQVSKGLCTDNRPASHGGRLWGEIS